MAKRSLGFGIVGCGMISQFHTAAIAEIPGARLVAVTDVVEASARRLAEAHRCAWHTDFREMVRRDDIDIVTVATPSGLHLEPAVAAAEAGKHVIVEKPIEITLPRVDAVIRAADRAGVKLATVFPERFNPASQALKRAVEAGRFGRLVLGDCYNKWWRSQDYYDSGGWRGTWRLDGGGACMNQAVHAIDLLQWMMGPVESVSAVTDRLAHVRIEVEDTAAALLRFRNGALGVIEAATSVYPGLKRRLEIHGDRGSVVYENENIVLWGFAEKRPSDARLRRRLAPLPDGESYGVSDPRNITHFGHAEVFRDMVRAVRTGGPVACGGREGRKAVEIILAIYRSARTKKTVRLPLKG